MTEDYRSRYVRLYGIAIQAERTSQSSRILRIHEKGQRCRVDLGISDPNLTEYVVVSRNPGGSELESEVADAEIWGGRQWTMRDYIGQTFSYARNLRKLIAAFAEHRGQCLEACADKFGVTDISCFASSSSGSLGMSFWQEVIESLPITEEEILAPKLKAIIFSGVEPHFFFYRLYKPGSPVEEFEVAVESKRIRGFRTRVKDGRNITVVYISHLSATRGMSNQYLADTGRALSALLP